MITPFHANGFNREITMNWLIYLNQNLSNSIRTYTPEIWFPLTIVLLNSIVHILNAHYIYSQIEYADTHQNIRIAISVLGGFFVIVGSLMSWLLTSVVLFFWCELFYDVEGAFRNFFEIVGICHFVLLIGTLICSIFILTGLLDNFTTLESDATDSQTVLEAIQVALSPLKFIGVVGRICFAFILVLVVRAFFQIRWLKAFCSVGIPYSIYWLLSKALQSVFQFS